MQEKLIAENDSLKEKLLTKTVKETEEEVNYYAVLIFEELINI